MEIKKLLIWIDYILYERFIYRKELKDKRKAIEKELEDIMNQLSDNCDTNIAKDYKISRERLRQLKGNLSSKCKRLGIDFNI